MKEDMNAVAWIDEHGSALYRYALMHTRHEQAAEELVQETFLAALQSMHRYEGGATVRTWLIGILKHKILDHFRRQSRETSLDELPEISSEIDEDSEDAFNERGGWKTKPSDWGNPLQSLESREFMEILQHCLDALPERLARLFMLREVMEENTEMICQEMSITPTNLWTMLYRARSGLRQCLDRNWGHAPGAK